MKRNAKLQNEVIFVRMNDGDLGLFVNGHLIAVEWSFEWDSSPLVMREPEGFFERMSSAINSGFVFKGYVDITVEDLIEWGVNEDDANGWQWSEVEDVVSKHWQELAGKCTV